MPRPRQPTDGYALGTHLSDHHRSLQLAELLSKKIIDQEDYDHLIADPDLELCKCPVCSVPYLKKEKHLKRSNMCSIHEQENFMIGKTFGDPDPDPPPERQSKRSFMPSEKKQAELEDKRQKEIAKRERLLQSMNPLHEDMSYGYDSDLHFSSGSEPDSLENEERSSDQSSDRPLVITNNGIPLPSSATTAARHLQDLPKRKRKSQKNDPSLLGCRLKADHIGIELDVPLLTDYEVVALKLREILNAGGATLGTFDRIVELINKNNHPTHGAFSSHISPLIPSRKSLLERVRTRFPTPKPKVVQVPTTSSGKSTSTSCIVFPFLEQLKEMLLDNNLMGDKDNLTIDPNTPLDLGAIPEDERGAEVVASFWYIKTIQVKIGTPNGKEMVIPILIYLDKTGVDRMQRWGLEPVIFTLGIFTAKACKQRKFWRCMGYLPDFDSYTSSAKKAKLRNS